MHKRKIRTILTSILSVLMVSVTTLTGGTANAFSPENVSSRIKATALYDGSEVYLVNDDVREIIDMDYFDPSWIKSLYTEGENNCAPVDMKLEWEAVSGATYYNVRVATDRDFRSVVDRFTVIGKTSVSVSVPLVGTTYYWQVETEVGGNKIVSGLFSFATADSPRMIYIDGVTNSRDIGGYATSLGVMRQGRVIRTARLEGITSAGLVTAKKLGIKTDLDFREAGEDGQADVSPLGSDIKYVNVPGPYYVYYTGKPLDSDSGKTAIKNIMQVFADADNYPVDMHCSFGKDRTGTVAFLLGALCGASKVQLERDFWLSVYSEAGAVEYAEIDNTYELFKETYNYIKNKFVGVTYADKTAAYLKSAGLTQTEIDAIRSNLLVKD